MKESRFSEEKMVSILREADRLPVARVACPHCVLAFDHRFTGGLIDRHVALNILTEEWLQELKLGR